MSYLAKYSRQLRAALLASALSAFVIAPSIEAQEQVQTLIAASKEPASQVYALSASPWEAKPQENLLYAQATQVPTPVPTPVPQPTYAQPAQAAPQNPVPAQDAAPQVPTYGQPAAAVPQNPAPQVPTYAQPVPEAEQIQGPAYAQPPAQGPAYAQPPAQGPAYAQPPAQGPAYAQPPDQGPAYAQPPAQGPTYSQPPDQGPAYAQPPDQGPAYAQPPAQAPAQPAPQVPQGQVQPIATSPEGEAQYPPQVLVADPDSTLAPQAPAPGALGTPQTSGTSEVDLILAAPKVPPTPEAAPVFMEMEKWHEKLLASYQVNLTGIPDPFMPIETVMRPPTTETKREPDKRLPMIQRLALNSFTLTAIVVHPNPNNSTALVDSGGVGYLIRKGTKIGPNNGVVKEITDNKVVIEEPEVNYKGDKRMRFTELKLNPIDTGLPEEGFMDDGSA